jgi:hypothetical protein
VAALFRKPFGWLHLIWAIGTVGACAVLVTTGGGGHPPAMIFLPVALLAGVLGHASWLSIAWLLGRGRARLERSGAVPSRWPLELRGIAVALGLVVVGVGVAWGIAVAEGANSTLRDEPLTELGLAAIVASHALALAVLLLRLDAARLLIAALMIGWALALGLALDDADVTRAGRAIAMLVVAGLLGGAVHVLRGRRIRSTLG